MTNRERLALRIRAETRARARRLAELEAAKDAAKDDGPFLTPELNRPVQDGPISEEELERRRAYWTERERQRRDRFQD